MRLPIVHQISTKDGVSNKNARLTNVLKETRKTGDLAVLRPGLEFADTYPGLGNGLIIFDGRLLVIGDDTIYDAEWGDFWWPLDSSEWDVSVTYTWGDFVWYNGELWASIAGGNVGNTPAAGAYWSSSYETQTYNASDTYDIGQPVTYNGVTYYSYRSSNTGNTPDSSSYWGLTAPTQTLKWTYDPPSSCLASNPATNQSFGNSLAAMYDFVATLNASSTCTGSGVYVYYVYSSTQIYYTQNGVPRAPYTPTFFAVTSV